MGEKLLSNKAAKIAVEDIVQKVMDIFEAEDGRVFVKPGFIGEEVTGDIHYYNSQLMKKPYTTWL